MDKENQSILKAKTQNKTHTPQLLINGDTVKQLLARSRYLLYKSRQNGPTTRRKSSYYLNCILILKAYDLSQQLRTIYNSYNDKNVAMLKLAHWYRKVEESGFKTLLFSIP
jgi:hypothetical protein